MGTNSAYTSEADPYEDGTLITVGGAAFPACRGFYCGSAGSATIVTKGGTTIAITALIAGYHPISITQVTAGTAGSFVAYY